MPIKKKEGEKKGDFINRCVGIEVARGKKPNQAVAICLSYWDELNMKAITKKREENLELTELRLKEISGIEFTKVADRDFTKFKWGVADAEREDEILLNLAEAVPPGFEPVYRYEADPGSGYGSAGVGSGSRKFCRTMMQDKERFYELKEITKLNGAPGKVDRVLNKESRKDARARGQKPPAANRVGYSVFNWRGGVNCKHVWVRYFYNKKTGELLQSPSQPANLPVGLA